MPGTLDFGSSYQAIVEVSVQFYLIGKLTHLWRHLQDNSSTVHPRKLHARLFSILCQEVTFKWYAPTPPFTRQLRKRFQRARKLCVLGSA